MKPTDLRGRSGVKEVLGRIHDHQQVLEAFGRWWSERYGLSPSATNDMNLSSTGFHASTREAFVAGYEARDARDREPTQPGTVVRVTNAGGSTYVAQLRVDSGGAPYWLPIGETKPYNWGALISGAASWQVLS